MKRIKIFLALLVAVMMINTIFNVVVANDNTFDLILTEKSDTLGGTVYHYKHKKTGAEVVYNQNDSKKLEFAIGFKTPLTDSKGANHVLEHALFCGSDKYPIKNIMHYIRNGTPSLILNGITADDCTYYLINSENETEYYNMMDVYMNGIFHPLFLNDENIFRQQGIRIEYADGKAQYNGVVYNELRIKNLNTEENSVNFLADKLYRSIYGDTAPSFNAGGDLHSIKELTYEDLLQVYNTYYIPSNSMTYLSGNQNINKTLKVLDDFFSENNKKAPDISFEDTKQIPAKAVSEYNVDENTKTIDIGFMSSGVPASADANERYGRDIIFDIIQERLKEETNCSDTYISGGNSGGVSNLALLISKIPIEKKDEIISAYHKVLKDLYNNGLEEKDIDNYIESQREYFYANSENVFSGLLYHKNPLAYTEINSICDYLKNHKEYFTEILKKYFTDNPYSTIIISGNGSFSSENISVDVTPEELEKIKTETEAFQKWNDEEDPPELIEKIPFLTLDTVKNAPEKSEPQYEKQSGISFYYTEKSGENNSDSAILYFPLNAASDDLNYVQLMYSFLQYQADKSENYFYAAASPFENADNPDEINPHFILGFSGENKAENIKKAIKFFQSEAPWNKSDLEEYIRTTPQKILDSYYDPYFLSSELKNSALSTAGRFSYVIPSNSIIKGSVPYYHFLQSLNLEDVSEILEKIKPMADDIIINNKPIVEYIGEIGEYENLRNTVKELFSKAAEQKSADFQLPIGCYSAATITKLEDANHFMITAPYGKKGYSGKLSVLGKLLSAKYITPTMRGKHGAYGSSISFLENGMTSAVTGIADIDLTIKIWQSIGDYLRNMNMSKKELDAFIVSAVMEYDEWYYKSSEYGADFALRGKTSEDCERIRNEMLSTTVADIKGYADFVDELISQMRVFAVLGKSAADNADFDFDYYGNAETLEVIPNLK